MKSRLLLCLLIGLLVLGILPVVAQDDSENPLAQLNCLDLSEADCALVGGMPEHGDLNSFSLEFNFSKSAGNAEDLAIPGLGDAISVNGTGTVAIDHAAMTEDNPMGGIAASVNVDSSTTTSDGTQAKHVSVVVVDGNLYIQNPDTGEWMGTSLLDLMKTPNAIPGMSFMGMSIPMDQFMGLGQQGMGMMGGDEAETTPSPMGDFQLSDILSLPGFISQSRGADETLDGQTMYAFTYTADLSVLLSNKDVQTAISDMFSNMGAGASDNPMMGQMGAMMPVILQNTTGTVTVTRWVGADDHFIHHLALDVEVSIDLFGGGSTSSDSTPIPPITFSITADATLHDINQAAAPTAPEGATVVPASEFMGHAEMTPEATP